MPRPILPDVIYTHALQQVVISVLVANNMLAKVEHRDVKQSFLNQVKHIDDSPCSAIAVIGWMNRLELMVYQCHLDQWVAYAQNSTNLGIRCAHVKKISICEHLQINKPADYLLEFAKLARLLGMSMRLIVRE
jgi:hypothetical protein